MPIEIKELVIRTVVTPVSPLMAEQCLDGPSDRPSPRPALDAEALVQECVRQVLRILAQQRER